MQVLARGAVRLAALGVLLLVARGPAAAEEEPDTGRAWWKTARARIEAVLARQGRTSGDLESPPWYEVPYSTVGRMPLIDTALREPLVLPEVAMWADDRAKAADGSLLALWVLAREMSEETTPSLPAPTLPGDPEWLSVVLSGLGAAPVPEEAVEPCARLLRAVAAAAALRDEAFSALTDEERAKVGAGLPGWFVRPGPQGESIVGYTTDTTHCLETLDLLRRVDFHGLDTAARLLAAAGDAARVDFARPPAPPWPDVGFVRVEVDTPLGKVAIGGTGNDVWTGEYALLLDLGGDDVYLGHAAATSLPGPGAAVLVDVSGNDVYRADRFAQGAAVAGTTLFMDLAGDDRYVSGHYSQGAALGGTSLFYEGGGDDEYTGDFGAQCFALFGTSVFVERGGRDSYRIGSMGQACASTLGVAILAEGGGDDVWRAGGKQGFYGTDDAACAQGAGSGMRPWPPNAKMTVYGGIGFLSEAGGNDAYDLAIIGQGGSYVFSLGILVDSAGDDAYRSMRYARGVGVHLSAGVAVDRAGDDVRTGFYGNDGYSLDRCSGVFLDLAGDDVYRTSGGIGFGHKPKGTGIFVDVQGKDTYAGTGMNHGKADIPFGDEAYSTGFFLDLGGADVYASAPGGATYANDAAWDEGTFGHGEDAEVAEPTRTAEGWWAPRSPVAEVRAAREDPADGILDLLQAPSALVRMTALDPAKVPVERILEAAAAAAGSGDPNVCRHLIDLVQILLTRKTVPATSVDPLPWLRAADRDMRLLGVNVVREAKAASPEVRGRVAEMATRDPSEEVRGMACLALSAVGSEAAVGPLVAALADPAWRVRRRAAVGLSEMRAPDACDAAAKALAEDGTPQVRAYAARTLGRIGRAEAVPQLEKALADADPFVRALAAEALVVGFRRKDAMDAWLALLDWDNGVLKERWVTGPLGDLAGQALPAARAEGETWWAQAKGSFDLAAAGATYERVLAARKARDEGREEEALAGYRAIRKDAPRHPGACKDLGEILNARAWDLAVEGKDLADALAMARECVDASPSSQAIDTLVVLLFLNDQRAEAEETLVKAMENATDADKALYERRLEQVHAGKVSL